MLGLLSIYMLKSVKIVALLIVLLLPFGLQAQNCDYNYWGTKTLYQAPAHQSALAPAGYQPVFINYVGRHGARHLTKQVSSYPGYLMLMKADSAKGLTAQGQKLKKMVLALDKVEHDMVKSISAEGIMELEGIGKRMSFNYPQVFGVNPQLNVSITKEIRTKQSADAFLKGLQSGFKGKAAINESTDDTNLRFYDASPAYNNFEDNGSWQSSMKQLQQSLKMDAINKQIAQRWFAPAFLKTLKTSQLEKMTTDIFGFATITASLKKEIQQAGFKLTDIDMASLFTCNELTALSKIDVADDYLKKGPGTNNNGLQVRVAVPLLINFITTTDEFIKTGHINAQLRFAHAETIAPFAAMLEITKANKVAKNITQLNRVWQSSQIIPLSSNIQWVFYRKKGTNDLLVKILLNEQAVQIQGLKTSISVYYKWTDLRAYYINKLNKLHVELTDNMEVYLSNVK